MEEPSLQMKDGKKQIVVWTWYLSEFPTGSRVIYQAAKAGGQIAKNTRDDLERQLGHTVISSERASDYIRPIEQQNADELPFEDEEK